MGIENTEYSALGEKPDTSAATFAPDKFFAIDNKGRYRYPYTALKTVTQRVKRDCKMAGLKPQHVLNNQAELIANSPVADNLLQARQGEFFVLPGFDLQAQIDQRAGAVVEIAGPTEQGFNTLENVSFNKRPYVSNIGSSEANLKAKGELDDYDQASLDFLADGGNLPFADSSLGVILLSCPPKTEVIQPDTSPPPNYLESISTATNLAMQELAAGKKPKELLADPRFGYFTRIRMCLEAQRALEPGGLMIMKGVTKEDILLLDQLGLKVAMHSLMTPVRGKLLPYEMVFQKPN